MATEPFDIMTNEHCKYPSFGFYLILFLVQSIITLIKLLRNDNKVSLLCCLYKRRSLLHNSAYFKIVLKIPKTSMFKLCKLCLIFLVIAVLSIINKIPKPNDQWLDGF